MPKIFGDAHQGLDKAFKTELERLEFLFALYRQYTEPTNVAMDEKPKRRMK